MKKTQKLHKKTKSYKIRKTRKLQKAGFRNPLKMFKSWRAKKRGTHTLTHGEPVVTHNPGFVYYQNNNPGYVEISGSESTARSGSQNKQFKIKIHEKEIKDKLLKYIATQSNETFSDSEKSNAEQIVENILTGNYNNINNNTRSDLLKELNTITKEINSGTVKQPQLPPPLPPRINSYKTGSNPVYAKSSKPKKPLSSLTNSERTERILRGAKPIRLGTNNKVSQSRVNSSNYQEIK
jgi:hypothetical protein